MPTRHSCSHRQRTSPKSVKFLAPKATWLLCGPGSQTGTILIWRITLPVPGDRGCDSTRNLPAAPQGSVLENGDISADLPKEILNSVRTLFALGSYLSAQPRLERPCLLLDELKNLAQDFLFWLTVPHHPFKPVQTKRMVRTDLNLINSQQRGSVQGLDSTPGLSIMTVGAWSSARWS